MPKLGPALTPLAASLRAGRKAKDLTRAELASILEVNVQTIGSWEAGATQPSAAFLLAFCRACDIDPRELA